MTMKLGTLIDFPLLLVGLQETESQSLSIHNKIFSHPIIPFYIDWHYTIKKYTLLLRITHFWMHPLWLHQLILKRIFWKCNDDLWNQRCSHLAGVEDVAIDILHHGPHLLGQVLLTRHEDCHLTLLQCFQSYTMEERILVFYQPRPIIIYWNIFSTEKIKKVISGLLNLKLYWNWQKG